MSLHTAWHLHTAFIFHFFFNGFAAHLAIVFGKVFHFIIYYAIFVERLMSFSCQLLLLLLLQILRILVWLLIVLNQILKLINVHRKLMRQWFLSYRTISALHNGLLHLLLNRRLFLNDWCGFWVKNAIKIVNPGRGRGLFMVSFFGLKGMRCFFFREIEICSYMQVFARLFYIDFEVAST